MVPKEYIDELKVHYMLYPSDLNVCRVALLASAVCGIDFLSLSSVLHWSLYVAVRVIASKVLHLISQNDYFYCVDGKLTCLEEGCNGVIIPLGRRLRAHDGGLGNGFGSLSAYRVICFLAMHITN